MNPFQSNNVWKRAARERRQLENPETPEQIRRRQLISTALWLAVGLVILSLLLTAIYSGILPLNIENGVIVSILGLYTLHNAVSLGRLWRNQSGKS